MKILQWRRWFWRIGMVAVLAGCSQFPVYPEIPVQYYDLGPVAEASAAARPWRVSVNAREELRAQAMRYRLLYDQPTEVRLYARSQWVEPPAGIVRKALETRLFWPEGAKADQCSLNLVLLRFEQEFDTPETSRGVLTIRAMLRRGGVIVDERLWTLAIPASSPDAIGGVTALAGSVNSLAEALQSWRAEQKEVCGTESPNQPYYPLDEF